MKKSQWTAIKYVSKPFSKFDNKYIIMLVYIMSFCFNFTTVNAKKNKRKKHLEGNVIQLKSFRLSVFIIAQRWACVPGFAFLRSRHFRNAGARERKFYAGMQEPGTRKNRNAKFAFLSRDEET